MESGATKTRVKYYSFNSLKSINPMYTVKTSFTSQTNGKFYRAKQNVPAGEYHLLSPEEQANFFYNSN